MDAKELANFVLHHHVDKAKRVDGMIHSKNVAAEAWQDRMTAGEIQWREALEEAADNYVRTLMRVKRAVKEGAPFLAVLVDNAAPFVQAIDALYTTAEMRRAQDPNDIWFGEILALVENLKDDANKVVAFLKNVPSMCRVPVIVSQVRTM